jgi:hypothetical protein
MQSMLAMEENELRSKLAIAELKLKLELVEKQRVNANKENMFEGV